MLPLLVVPILSFDPRWWGSIFRIVLVRLATGGLSGSILIIMCRHCRIEFLVRPSSVMNGFIMGISKFKRKNYCSGLLFWRIMRWPVRWLLFLGLEGKSRLCRSVAMLGSNTLVWSTLLDFLRDWFTWMRLWQFWKTSLRESTLCRNSLRYSE